MKDRFTRFPHAPALPQLLVMAIVAWTTGQAKAQFGSGPCCLPNGSCIVDFHSTCTGLGGTIVNGRDGCTGITCSGSGACCLPDGSCSQLSPTGCSSALGEYNGNATSCANLSCAGACCLPDKGCVETGLSDCDELDGTFQGRSTICADDCPTRMPTAFTYQGQLSQGGAPLNDVVDARFSLWLSLDGLDPANQIGGTEQINSIDVVNGLFQAEVDFGQNAFNGNARWLQIELRDSGSPDPFTVLEPRTALTPTPYALQTRGIVVREDGRVGIGTKLPAAGLHIKREAVPVSGTLALDGDTRAYMTFFLNTLIPGRKGYLGFETFPHLTIANEQLGGRIVLSTPGSSVFATGGEENLRIVRGIVSGSGAIIHGVGYTVTHPETGVYIINFGLPFAGVPSVTANAEYPCCNPDYATITDPQSSRVTIRFWYTDPSDSGNFTESNSTFHFVAIGPR